ncbi:MAG: mechanosensitive ion channel protein MscS [Clostridiales bacterium GWF2_36_10]|nr:MAG: mechanosensitive ion channel protein MscS [Clostridiales bacterium GWF2_36_10]HAN21685.1 mechanosensitive ion channel protein MscS [Clostridiales bacterium]
MFEFVFDIIKKIGAGSYTNLIAYTIIFIFILIICIVIKLISKVALVRIMTKITKQTKYKWDDILVKNKFFHRLSWLSIPVILKIISGNLPNYNSLLEKIADIILILLFVFITSSLINSFDEIYRGFEVSKVRPIKGLLQVAKVVLFIIGSVILISLLIGENPIVLLGGIGALTAIISLIFKDAILGFVAGIQLTANDMIRIGDWIEMPKHSADGIVIDLSLTTVKVQNFDYTVTAVPAYSLVSDSFINWRGMEKLGGRRIKRSFNIDTEGVKLCENDMLNKLRKITLINEYIDNKLVEINDYNNELGADMTTLVNGKHLTNLGTFRIYIYEYLKKNPHIRKDMPLMVRQLKYEGEGIPLELYAFTNTIKWEEYEGIQADIFDHLYSVISEFELSIYQQPTGRDIRISLGKK